MARSSHRPAWYHHHGACALGPAGTVHAAVLGGPTVPSHWGETQHRYSPVWKQWGRVGEGGVKREKKSEALAAWPASSKRQREMKRWKGEEENKAIAVEWIALVKTFSSSQANFLSWWNKYHGEILCIFSICVCKEEEKKNGRKCFLWVMFLWPKINLDNRTLHLKYAVKIND